VNAECQLEGMALHCIVEAGNPAVKRDSGGQVGGCGFCKPAESLSSGRWVNTRCLAVHLFINGFGAFLDVPSF